MSTPTATIALTREEVLVLVRHHHDEALKYLNPKFLTSITEPLPLDHDSLNKASQHIEKAKEFSKIADEMYAGEPATSKGGKK